MNGMVKQKTKNKKNAFRPRDQYFFLREYRENLRSPSSAPKTLTWYQVYRRTATHDRFTTVRARYTWKKFMSVLYALFPTKVWPHGARARGAGGYYSRGWSVVQLIIIFPGMKAKCCNWTHATRRVRAIPPPANGENVALPPAPTPAALPYPLDDST